MVTNLKYLLFAIPLFAIASWEMDFDDDFYSALPNVAWYEVTTTGANQINTIALEFSATTVVDWGDGQRDTYSGSAVRTHSYAVAGTYKVSILSPANVTTFNNADNKVTLHSRNIKRMVNVTYFRVVAARGGSFYSSDVASWRPTTFYLLSMPAGYTGTFNSSDVASWRPTIFYLVLMPAGYAGTFNSSDVASWRPEHFLLYSMPTSTTLVVSNNSFTNFTTTAYFEMQNNRLTTNQVDTILSDLYIASKSRTATGTGTEIDLRGNNQAPSGTFQACSTPPVSTNTPGKEIAYELKNDSLNVLPYQWANVYYNN